MTLRTLPGVMYRPPSKPPVTAWARHLDAVMREHNWSQTQLFEQVYERLGYAAKSRTGFRPLLIDREPSAAQARILAEMFGEPPVVDAPADVQEPGHLGDMAGLVGAMTAALLAQAEALTDLRAELRETRDDAHAEREAMTRMLARLEARLSELQPHAGTAATAAAQDRDRP